MRCLSLLLLSSLLLHAAEPTQTIKLWPGKAPGDPENLPAEKLTPPDPVKKSVLTITNVSTPLIDVYLAAKPSGAFVLVAPGGGYNLLAYEHEGTDVAKWLNDRGVSAGVLKYRVPRREGVTPEYQPMLQDAQRAIRIVRAHANEWKLDDKKIGMLGFSAGGHLTASTATMKPAYDAIDETDKLPPTIDFAALIYPGGLVEKDSTKLKPEFAITKNAPPMFFVHASDDRVASENSIALYRELKKNGVAAELHLYASGGHGFGLGRGYTASWPKRCEDWLKLHGMIK